MKRMDVLLFLLLVSSLSGCVGEEETDRAGPLSRGFEAVYRSGEFLLRYELEGPTDILAPWGGRVDAYPLSRFYQDRETGDWTLQNVDWFLPDLTRIRHDYLCQRSHVGECRSSRIGYGHGTGIDMLGLRFRDLAPGLHRVPFGLAEVVAEAPVVVSEQEGQKIVDIDGKATGFMAAAKIRYVYQIGEPVPTEIMRAYEHPESFDHYVLESWGWTDWLEAIEADVPPFPEELHPYDLFAGDTESIDGFEHTPKELIDLILQERPVAREMVEDGGCFSGVDFRAVADEDMLSEVDREVGEIWLTLVSPDGSGTRWREELRWSMLRGYELVNRDIVAVKDRDCHGAREPSFRLTLQDAEQRAEDLLRTSAPPMRIGFETYPTGLVPAEAGWSRFTVSATPGWAQEVKDSFVGGGSISYLPDGVTWNTRTGWILDMDVSPEDYERMA